MANQIEIKGSLSAGKFGILPYDFSLPVAPIVEQLHVTSGVSINVSVDNDEVTIQVKALSLLNVKRTFSQIGRAHV